MKFLSLGAVLMLGLALNSSVKGSSLKMYSATAKAVIGIPVCGDLGPALLKEKYEKEIIAYETPCILPASSLESIIHSLKLDRIWARRFHSFKNSLSEQEAIGHLRDVVKVEFPNGTNFIKAVPMGDYYEFAPDLLILKITASSEVPQEAADIANAVVDRYKAIRDQEDFDRNKHSLDALKEQIVEQTRVVADLKMTTAQSRNDAHARRALEDQQALLNALNTKLRQDVADVALQQSPVKILSRAVAPPQ